MKRTTLTLITLSLLLVPMVNAVTIDGPTNFQGPHGGNTRFNTVVTSTQIEIINWIYGFRGFREGGQGFGVVGFDCSAGDNMTILSIALHQVSYNMSGPSTSYVMFQGYGTPSEVTGGTYTYNAVNETIIVTTTGASTVTIRWVPEQNSLFTDLMTYVKLGMLIPVIAAIAYLLMLYNGAEFDSRIAVLIVSLLIAMIVMAAVLSGYA